MGGSFHLNGCVRAAVFALFVFCPRRAYAERDLIVPFHDPGHVVVDGVAGLRLSQTGATYAGFGGFATRSDESDALTPGLAKASTSLSTVWLAPSADVFVTDHLSLGGRIELSHTWGGGERGGERFEIPGATSIAVLPRIGFFVPFGDRLGLWTRAGVGWNRTEAIVLEGAGDAGAPSLRTSTSTFRSLVLEVDLAVVYRLTEAFFMRVGPELALTLGGRQEIDVAGVRGAGAASSLHIGVLTAFGIHLEP